MGILDRFSKIVQANVNDLMQGHDEPEHMLEAAIREMERELHSAQASLKDSQRLADEATSRADLRTKEAAKFEERANAARAEGRPQAAAELEAFKTKALAGAQTLKQEADKAQQSTSELTHAVSELEKAIGETRGKQRELGERLQQVRQHGRTQSAGDLGDSRPRWRPDDDDGKSHRVEAEINRLARDQDVEDKLAALKKKLRGG